MHPLNHKAARFEHLERKEEIIKGISHSSKLLNIYRARPGS